ncbi:MAG: PAS domain-containing protein [Methanosarcinaceae archaeon]|nr:PAS domain-containing protein [Methanosarcinaceae archaeon]
MEKFLSTSPNPVLLAGETGKVLYANRAGDNFLREWKIQVGDELPSFVRNIMGRVISQKIPEEFEIRAGSRIYLFSFHPLPDEGYVSLCGFDITAQKNKEKTLKNNEEKYRNVTEQTGQLILDYAVSKGTTDWAGAIEELTGYSEEIFRNFGMENFIEHVHPEDRKKVLEAYFNCMNYGGKYHEEYRFRRKDWGYFYVEGTWICLKDEAGSIYRVLGVLKDITERKLARDMFEKKEQKFRLVVEQTGQLFYEYNVKNNEIKWAGAVEKITGYRPEEVRKVGIAFWFEHVHPEDLEKVRKRRDECMRTGEQFRMDYRLRKKDEGYLYVEDQSLYQKNEEGSVYRVLGVVKDVTERRLILEKLEKSDERIRIIVEQTSQGIYDYDVFADRLRWEGAMELITGYSCKDPCLSSKKLWISRIHPEDRKKAADYFEEALKKGEKYQQEYRVERKDGTYIHVEVSGAFLKDEKGQAYRLLGIIKNVTEKKLLEEGMRKAEEIRKKEIHHRIKNNLQVISSLLDLQAGFFENEIVREAFRESQNRVISMALIHEELYRGTDVETLDFAAYLRKLASDLFESYTVGDGKIRLNVEVEERIYLCMDTAIPLGIIVNELVSNSLKHAFPEGGEGEIRIQLYGQGKARSKDSDVKWGSLEGGGMKKDKCCEKLWCTLDVSDNGSGFPEGLDLEKPDTLGLQLVKTLVEQIEGNIELRTNGGTKFSIGFGIHSHM